jgi:hypothetical protein
MVLKRLTILLMCLCASASAETLAIQETGASHYMEDMGMRGNSPYFDYNYGGATTFILDSLAGSNRTAVWKFTNWDTLLTLNAGNVFDSAIFRIHCITQNGATDARLRRLKVAWYEGTGTGTAGQVHMGNGADRWEGNEPDEETDSAWGANCATSLDDVDLSDAYATPLATSVVPAENGVDIEFRLTSAAAIAHVDSLINGLGNNFGWMIWINDNVLTTFASTEYTTNTGVRPILTIYYTPPEAATGSRRRALLMGE